MVKIDDKMKKSITVNSIVAIIAILVFFVLFNFSSIFTVIGSIAKLILPFIIGFFIAFLLNKPMMYIEKVIKEKTKFKDRTCRVIATTIVVVVAILIVMLLILIILPDLIKSVDTLIKQIPDYAKQLELFANDIVKQFNLDPKILDDIGKDSELVKNMQTYLTENLPILIDFATKILKGIFNVFVGIFAAVYMLLDKERLLNFFKLLNKALFKHEVSSYISVISKRADEIFIDFIVGKALDSLIIGILCYIGMLVLGLPYASILSLIVGVTNMIPVFGPFIGAIPGIMLILIINPPSAIVFAIFILVLQQFDGNILGPLILGDKLGIPSLCILIAVVIGGGLFGFIGMFIGVPVFALLYSCVKEWIEFRNNIKKEKTIK